MPALRFLFGPTTAEFADTRLAGARRDGSCLAFGQVGVDLTVGPAARWDEIAAQFPAGWQPDLVALWLNYTTVPNCLWSAPVPVVGLATDWNLLWHEYRSVLRFCDASLTDVPGVERLTLAGIADARPAVLYGAAPNLLDCPKTSERDIDVLFVGNLHPAVQRERLPWLARLVKLADRWNVQIRTGVSGDECRALLGRSRVVFNRSVRSEANMRAFEAAAAGALLFQEAGNREVPGLFADRLECAYYHDEDLEELLEYYLSHEDERRAIAEAAREKVSSYTFPSLLMGALEELWETDHDGLVERARRRCGERGRCGMNAAGDGVGDGEARSEAAGSDCSNGSSNSLAVRDSSCAQGEPLLGAGLLTQTEQLLLGAGLLTPTECPTAGLLTSEGTPLAQMPSMSGASIGAGDLRSGTPAGSGDPRRASATPAATPAGSGDPRQASVTPAATLRVPGDPRRASLPSFGLGTAGALTSPIPSFGSGAGDALPAANPSFGSGAGGALPTANPSFGSGAGGALPTANPSFGSGAGGALPTANPSFGLGAGDALPTPPNPPFARGGKYVGVRGARGDSSSALERLRSLAGARLPLIARVWMRLGDAATSSDDQLDADLTAEGESGSALAAIAWHALGVLAREPVAAVEAFRLALTANPRSAASGMALALSLAASSQRDAATEQARLVLQSLERVQNHGEADAETDLAVWDLPTYPSRFDDLRVEWERAAWVHAGNPGGEITAKRALVRWRLHTLLAELTGELTHYEAAAMARADLPATRAVLGCALARAGRLADALPHLRQAVADQPFDVAAARALFQVLGDLGMAVEQRVFVRERRLLARIAPQVVMPEPWFATSEQGLARTDPSVKLPAETLILSMGPAEFAARFGSPDVSRALCGYTRAADTRAVLTLLAHARPRRVLEVGTALGHMTANLAEWSPDDAHIFSLGIVRGMEARGATEQHDETPPRAEFGRLADHFGKGHKVYFVIADSLGYDFGRLAPLDFVFIDGGHSLEHARNDSRRAYEAIQNGGWLVWHDFNSKVAWVKVREAVETLGLLDPVIHLAGTDVAFLRKQAPLPTSRPQSHQGTTLPSPSSTGQRSTWQPPNPPCPPFVRGGRTLGPHQEDACRIHAPRSIKTNFSLPQADAPRSPDARPMAQTLKPVRLVWEGDQEGLHSLALVNRALCRELLNRGHDLGLLAGIEGNGVRTSERLPDDPRLSARFGRGPDGGPAQVHVRHRWPPKLEPPEQGRWVFMQPWEFGSLPSAWLPALGRVDEVWAYSRSVRDCYLDAGVAADRVHVIPLGVDPAVFRPDAEPLPLPPGPSFRFLFVGGTIPRKGFDLLLTAYTRAFNPTDGVGLVIKDMGTNSFYRAQTAGAVVAEHQARGYPIEYRDDALTEQELAGLYTACDCLAHPYRGEGFALPVVEAMACGIPAIVTGAGPALDYASQATAFLVPARRARFPEKRVGDIETISRPWLWEPDLDALVETLRKAASDRAATRAKGAAASAWIRGRFTWSHSADAVEKRLRSLTAM